MRLNEIRDNPGARTARKRVGRGMGSGTGKTAGKGHKGQKSRSGRGAIVGFEGGQMPLYRRLPKRGFKNPGAKDYVEIGTGALQKAVDAGKLDAKGTVDEQALKAAGLIKRRRDGVRLLVKGELKAKLTLELTGATKGAIAAVEKAGGKIALSGPPPKAESAKAPAKDAEAPAPEAEKPAPKKKAKAPAGEAEEAKAETTAKPKSKKKAEEAPEDSSGDDGTE